MDLCKIKIISDSEVDNPTNRNQKNFKDIIAPNFLEMKKELNLVHKGMPGNIGFQDILMEGDRQGDTSWSSS